MKIECKTAAPALWRFPSCRKQKLPSGSKLTELVAMLGSFEGAAQARRAAA
ncbi:hypothetical protein OKA06_01445 [Novosphingobium sp. MW5]|nr:hypothetical protein [Novosphingobium sp. MW5]